MERHEAEQALIAWASVGRDELVRAAYQAGVTKSRIHELTGIGRSTIDRILEASVNQEQLTRLVKYLTDYTANWPRQHHAAWAFYTPPPPMADTYKAEDIAESMFAEAAFKAIKLGTVLNTPDGRLLVAAVEALTPLAYAKDVELLVAALRIAAGLQQAQARETVVKAVFGVAVAAVAVAAIGNSG